jgi:hypothetical protein
MLAISRYLYFRGRIILLAAVHCAGMFAQQMHRMNDINLSLTNYFPVEAKNPCSSFVSPGFDFSISYIKTDSSYMQTGKFHSIFLGGFNYYYYTQQMDPLYQSMTGITGIEFKSFQFHAGLGMNLRHELKNGNAIKFDNCLVLNSCVDRSVSDRIPVVTIKHDQQGNPSYQVYSGGPIESGETLIHYYMRLSADLVTFKKAYLNFQLACSLPLFRMSNSYLDPYSAQIFAGVGLNFRKKYRIRDDWNNRPGPI